MTKRKWKYPCGFSRWLAKQVNDDSAIGDLARDAIQDGNWPHKAKRFEEFHAYLRSRNTCQGAIDALADAWQLYSHQADTLERSTSHSAEVQ